MNKLVLLVLLSVAMVSQVLSRCQDYTTRSSCERENNCYWCDVTNMCKRRGS